jgi:hypothetical protein
MNHSSTALSGPARKGESSESRLCSPLHLFGTMSLKADKSQTFATTHSRPKVREIRIIAEKAWQMNEFIENQKEGIWLAVPSSIGHGSCTRKT